MKISLVDGIYLKADQELAKFIKPYLKYSVEVWRDGAYSKKKSIKDAYMIKADGRFLAGLKNKIIDICEKSSIKIEEEPTFKIIPENKPSLKNIVFHNYQLLTIKEVIKEQKGIVLSPTGSGKTVIAGGIISCFPKAKVLFLAHTIDLVNQAADEFSKFGLKKIYKMGAGKKELDKKAHIVISTIQTFCKLNPIDWCDHFDITIVDETHHAAILKSQYGKVMLHNLSQMKIGFTATLPEGKQKLLTMEGLFGPVLSNIKIEDANLAKPVIKLISYQKNEIIADLKRYNDIYKAGIINNKYRNREIIKIVKFETEKNNTCLIMIKEIEHANILLEMFLKININVEFVQGSTESDMRTKLKKYLNDKKIKAVISTSVWREGINIPSLNCIINACGGKSEIMTLQAIGRGLRKTDNKKEIIIYDFLDNYRYLAEHSIERLKIYNEKGWL